jgi:hypothetical protein
MESKSGWFLLDLSNMGAMLSVGRHIFTLQAENRLFSIQ